ncbi:MAG TPA: DNA polymerase ligase N-terminal domain-containing protein [Planctomycetaceae bacterium]|nr:DNA polymerase ligase N-terminal domain-containing protein [Planctomycetaceae bacterium]
MPRFVILTHDYPVLHWDFMLEKEAALRTWRLLQPADAPGEIAAEPLPDHRLAYLDYEGPVSGNRGHVARWDQGTYLPLVDREDCVEIDLVGGKLIGRARLWRTGDRDAWRFHFTASSTESLS